MENPAVIFLTIFINRLTEMAKRSLIVRFGWSDETTSATVLGASLVLGALGVIFIFPSVNLIAGLGASPIAEQIVTGVIIGGLANGVDFLGRVAERAIQKPTTTKQVASTDISIDVQKAA